MRIKNLLAPLPSSSASIFFTLMFLMFFIALCWFVYKKTRKPIYEHLSQLPLEDK